MVKLTAATAKSWYDAETTLNRELKGSEHERSEKLMITYMLRAVRVHDMAPASATPCAPAPAASNVR